MNNKIMHKAFFVLRLLLGLILLVSSITKQIALVDFIEVFQSYGLVPLSLVKPVAIFLCSIELVLGIMILFNINGKLAVKASIMLLALFLAFSLYSTIFEKEWICRCFGNLFNQTINYATLIRDLMFLFIAFIVYKNYSGVFSYETITRKLVLTLFVFLIVLFPHLYLRMVNTNEKLKVGDKIAIHQILNRNESKQYLLLFVFSIDDCHSCLEEAYFWNKLLDTTNDKVEALIIGHSNRKILLDSFMKHKGLKLPVIYDPQKNLINSLCMTTPTKVLIDNKNKILDITRMLGSIGSFNEYSIRIKSIIK